MAIMDSKLLLAEDLAPGNVGAHDSTNILDLGTGLDAFGAASALSRPGEGGENWLNIVITTAIAATGGAAEVAWELQDCDTVGGSYANAGVSTGAIAKASLTAGTIVYSAPLPSDLREFVKLVCTVTTNNITSGAYSAWIGGPFQTPK